MRLRGLRISLGAPVRSSMWTIMAALPSAPAPALITSGSGREPGGCAVWVVGWGMGGVGRGDRRCEGRWGLITCPIIRAAIQSRISRPGLPPLIQAAGNQTTSDIHHWAPQLSSQKRLGALFRGFHDRKQGFLLEITGREPRVLCITRVSLTDRCM